MADEQKLATMYVEIKAKTEQLQNDLNALKRKSTDTAKGMGNGFSGLTGAFAKLGVGVIAVSATFNFLKTSIKEARDAKIAFAQVEQAVRQTGGAAGYSAKQIKGFANELEKSISIDADTILKDVSLQLLTFGKIHGDVFKRAQQSVLDLSAVLGSDLKSQSIQVGKALEDPIKGVTALSKAGVIFTEVQKENIKQSVKQNNLYGAQIIILDEINSKYGGQATILAEANGGISKLDIAWNNFSENVGAALLPVLDDVTTALADVLTPSKDLYTQWEEQTKKVNDLEKNLLPLASRYDVLSSKTKLNKNEQTELNSILVKLGTAFPSAVTGIDAYGVAIGINTEVIKENIRLEKLRLQYINASAIAETEATIQQLKNDKLKIESSTKSGATKTVTNSQGIAGGGSISSSRNVVLSDKELEANRKQFGELEDLIIGATQNLKRLKGEYLDEINSKVNDSGNGDKVGNNVLPDKNEVDIAIENYKKLKKSIEDFQNAYNKENNPEIKAILKVEVDSAQEQLDSLQLKAGLKIDIDEKSQADFLSEMDAINKKESENVDSQGSKYLEEKLNYQKQLQQDYVDAVGLLNEQAYQSELNKLNKEYEAEIEKYGLTEEAKAVHDANMLELDAKRQEQEDVITESKLTNIQAIEEAMHGFSQLSKAIGGEDSAAYKAFAITEATIATYLAATKALVYQPPWVGVALAAATIATGLANVANIVSAHEGGTFKNGKKIASFAQGGAFTVPNGYPNDSFPMFVESGEKVIVVPKHKADSIPNFSEGTDSFINAATLSINPDVSSNYNKVLSNKTHTNSNADVVNAIGALNKNISNLDRKVIKLDIEGKNLAKIVLGNINDLESSGYDTSFM